MKHKKQDETCNLLFKVNFYIPVFFFDLNQECSPIYVLSPLNFFDFLSFCFSYAGGYNACEFGDFTVVHALTGWLPEVIPLR